MNQASNMTEQEVIEELVQLIAPLDLDSQNTKRRIKKLEKSGIYCQFLRQKEFKKVLYQRLGIQLDESSDRLSELSIEGELLIHSHRTLTQRSLRMFESGPIHYSDTVGCLINGSLRGILNINF